MSAPTLPQSHRATLQPAKIIRTVRFLDDPSLRWSLIVAPASNGFRVVVTPEFCRMAQQNRFYGDTAEIAEIQGLRYIDRVIGELLAAREPDYQFDWGRYCERPLSTVPDDYLAFVKSTFPESTPRHQAAVAELGRRSLPL